MQGVLLASPGRLALPHLPLYALLNERTIMTRCVAGNILVAYKRICLYVCVCL